MPLVLPNESLKIDIENASMEDVVVGLRLGMCHSLREAQGDSSS